MGDAGASPVWVLGVNIGLHDSAAAVLRDGAIVAIGEQERFSRNKRATGEAPLDAVRFCLDAARISFTDLSAVGLGTDMKLLDEWHGWSESALAKREQLDDPDRLFPRHIFEYDKLPPIVPVRHHLAHAASAFRVSGFEEAAILVVDNRGENSSTTLAYGTREGIRDLISYGVPVSLGLYYRTAAQYAGLCGRHREVGKFMGLASYGKPLERVPLAYGEGGPYFEGLDEPPPMRGIELPPYLTRQLSNYYVQHCFPFYHGDGAEVMAYANFAASVQSSLERTLLALCADLKQRTGSDNLVMAGGVALNCTANGVVAGSGLFKGMFVQPMAGDSGVALGAALEVSSQLMGDSLPSCEMRHAYWGPQFSQAEINAALERHGLAYEVLDEAGLVEAVAQALAEFRTVGWFQGRAEVGPRALGARSLLANPTRRDSLIRLNTIKSREMWRPLAPSVLEPRFDEFFTQTQKSPFMIIASEVRPEKRSLIPAVVHVDGSARPQVVSRDANPRYWQLISAFERRTGIPMLVNTSFNRKDEPIVNTPDDAIQCFLHTGLDYLTVGDALVRKQ